MEFPAALGFDVETVGDIQEYALQPCRMLQGKAHISAASFATLEKTSGSLNPTTELMRGMFRRAIDKQMYVVGWNAAFDAAWAIAAGLEDEVMQVKWLDAMLLWRHAVVEPEGDDIPRTHRKSYALAAALKEFAPEHAGFKDFEDFQSEDADDLRLLLHRNQQDALWTVRLAKRFWEMLTDEQQRAALIEARCIPLCAWTKVHGIVGGKQAAKELSKTLQEDAKRIQAELLAAAPEAEGINLGSVKQLQTLLYDTWGLPAERFSKKTNLPSTDKYALFDLAVLDPRAKLIKELREAKNNRTKYAQGTIKSLEYNEDGRVRPQVKIFSTYSGRMTYASSDRSTREVEKTTKKNGTQMVETRAEVPVGVALHQWKRGKEYRRLVAAPEGFTLCEFDFCGQEFRWMAVASEDETMLSLCAPGEDAHSYMGAQIAQCDYRELIRRVHADEEDAKISRKLGKFCIAEGELVLTDQGLVPIEDVSLDHRVWDGVEWVSHTGSVCQGEKEVMTYDGLTATPDHIVYTQEGIRCYFWEAAEKSYRLARTGRGREALRALDHPEHGDPERHPPSGYLCSLPVRLRSRRPSVCMESDQREIHSVQALPGVGETCQGGQADCQESHRCQSAKTSQCNVPKMYEPKRSILSQLWRSWDSISIWIGSGSCKLYIKRATSQNLRQLGHRPDRQRRTLRAWQSTALQPIRKLKQQANQACRVISGKDVLSQRTDRVIQRVLPADEVRRLDNQRFSGEGPHSRSNYQKVARKVCKTYDVTNAGPRHRYTVSDVLLDNSNLSFQYRVSARTATTKARIDYELDVTEAFIQKIQATYKQSYVGVGGLPTQRNGGYWGRQIVKCKQLGYAETYAGRRVQLKGNWAGREAWPMESTAINYPIQGTGADQKYLALAVLRTILPQYGAYFYFELHDGLFIIIPDQHVAKAVPEIQRRLSNLPYKEAWGVTLPIQFPTDAKTGKTWGDLKDFP